MRPRPKRNRWFADSVPLLRKAHLCVANRRRRHEGRSHLQVQARDGNACLEWLPIAFPFAEGPRDAMGRAARKWQLRRCILSMECRDAPAERPEQIPRRPGRVAMWFVSGNRDDDAIADPHDLIVDRPRAREHISFGFGVHRCIGNRLAELQLRVLWERS
jgi:hypothetical protein